MSLAKKESKWVILLFTIIIFFSCSILIVVSFCNGESYTVTTDNQGIGASSNKGGGAYSRGYLGMSLPAYFQVFAITSPWNTIIPENPYIDPYSEVMIINLKNRATILKASITKWTIPLFVIDSEVSPKRDVKTTAECLNPIVDPDGNNIAEGLPIPGGVWPDPEEDGHMVLVDPYLRKDWEFSRAQRLSDGSWIASRIDMWDLDSSGYRAPFSGKCWWTYGASGSGMPLIAGLIRPEEIAAGEINHALLCASPINRNTPVIGGNPQLCNPTASRTDGQGVGYEYIPEGARLQLDPDLDLNSLNLTPETKIIARAMQKYGMYNGMNSTNFKLFFQNLGPDGGVWKNYNYFNDLANIPIERFRVLKCNLVTKP